MRLFDRGLRFPGPCASPSGSLSRWRHHHTTSGVVMAACSVAHRNPCWIPAHTSHTRGVQPAHISPFRCPASALPTVPSSGPSLANDADPMACLGGLAGLGLRRPVPADGPQPALLPLFPHTGCRSQRPTGARGGGRAGAGGPAAPSRPAGPDLLRRQR